MSEICDKCGKPIPPDSGRCIFCQKARKESEPPDEVAPVTVMPETMPKMSLSKVSYEYVAECPKHGKMTIKIKAKVLVDSVKCPFC